MICGEVLPRYRPAHQSDGRTYHRAKAGTR